MQKFKVKLTCTIQASTAPKLVKELEDILSLVKLERNDVTCRGCTQKKECRIGGGSSESGLESDWILTRKIQNNKRL
jgi:hypothetical protein